MTIKTLQWNLNCNVLLWWKIEFKRVCIPIVNDLNVVEVAIMLVSYEECWAGQNLLRALLVFAYNLLLNYPPLLLFLKCCSWLYICNNYILLAAFLFLYFHIICYVLWPFLDLSIDAMDVSGEQQVCSLFDYSIMISCRRTWAGNFNCNYFHASTWKQEIYI